jgi:hypothetical protein
VGIDDQINAVIPKLIRWIAVQAYRNIGETNILPLIVEALKRPEDQTANEVT